MTISPTAIKSLSSRDLEESIKSVCARLPKNCMGLDWREARRRQPQLVSVYESLISEANRRILASL